LVVLLLLLLPRRQQQQRGGRWGSDREGEQVHHPMRPRPQPPPLPRNGAFLGAVHFGNGRRTPDRNKMWSKKKQEKS